MGMTERHTSQFIGGQWIEPVNVENFGEVVDPSTNNIACRIAYGSELDVDKAVDSASSAFREFSCTPLHQRLQLIEGIVEVYKRRMADVAEAISTEMGAPYHTLSLPLQAPAGLWHFESALASAKQLDFKYALNSSTRVVREPIGVCALITPWNWPLNQIATKVAPALIAGCTMVLKPSPDAALSAIVIADILKEAGVPDGVFNLVQGDGVRLGERLAAHPLVDMISLTGSGRAGAAVSHAGADSAKRVSLELGGKSANIILRGAHLEKAVEHGTRLMMRNSGQSCSAPSRMFVHRDDMAQVHEVAQKVVRDLVVGLPTAEGTQMGPIANRRQFERVKYFIERGVSEGAELLHGGTDPIQELGAGLFVRPTIFGGVCNSMEIAQEEIFGPVLSIIPYRSIEEAIALANDTRYGLSGYVWGETVEQAERIALQLRTGEVHLNGADNDTMAPFGGYKQSGVGREWGKWGIEEFLETKAILGATSHVV